MKIASIILNGFGIALQISWAILSKGQAWWLNLFCAMFAVAAIVTACTAKRKNGWYIACGILDIIFGSLLGGIFMLCVKEESLR